MKKIIYTTDYSENSVAALKHAVNLGKMLETDVIALHVYDPSEEDRENNIRKKHQEKLMQFCEGHLAEQFSGSLLSVAAVKGSNVPKAILEFVRDLDVSIIVMGACGTSTLKEMFIGSTTKELTGLSPFPVLAVPANHKYTALREVMVPSTLEEKDIESIQEVIKILSPIAPQIEVVHVTHKEKTEADEALAAFREKTLGKVPYSHLVFRSIPSPQVYEALKREIDESRPDLVVIRDYTDKNGVNKLIIRDKLKWIQSCTRVPFLTFPAER